MIPALVETYTIPELPLDWHFDTVPILKKLLQAKTALIDLRGQALRVPNPAILINTLAITEAQASSEIENIITTQDLAFQASLLPHQENDPIAKEVLAHREALMLGYSLMKNRQNIISNTSLVAMFQALKGSTQGFRTHQGTALLNQSSGEIVHVPPQSPEAVERHMQSLEAYINEADGPLDPLIKMAIIHHQFESIHPFADGNGRLGRILNVLYLVKSGLLDMPILYLSRFITRNKGEYYRLLQAVRDEGAWDDWVMYMLTGIEETAHQAVRLVKDLAELMTTVKYQIKAGLPKLYSHELMNNIFRHPYTKIDILAQEVGVQRQTASRYLQALAAAGILETQKIGRTQFYINRPLMALLTR